MLPHLILRSGNDCANKHLKRKKVTNWLRDNMVIQIDCQHLPIYGVGFWHQVHRIKMQCAVFHKTLKYCIFCHQTVFLTLLKWHAKSNKTYSKHQWELTWLFHTCWAPVILSRFCFFCQTFAIGSVKLLSKPNHEYGMLWKPSLVFQYQRSCVGKQQQHNQSLSVISEMLSKVADQPSKD